MPDKSEPTCLIPCRDNVQGRCSSLDGCRKQPPPAPEAVAAAEQLRQQGQDDGELQAAIERNENIVISYQDTAPECTNAWRARQSAAWLLELRRLRIIVAGEPERFTQHARRLQAKETELQRQLLNLASERDGLRQRLAAAEEECTVHRWAANDLGRELADARAAWPALRDALDLPSVALPADGVRRAEEWHRELQRLRKTVTEQAELIRRQIEQGDEDEEATVAHLRSALHAANRRGEALAVALEALTLGPKHQAFPADCPARCPAGCALREQCEKEEA